MAFTYSPRIVAFLDILGFSELVTRSVAEPAVFATVINSLAIPQAYGFKWDDAAFSSDVLQKIDVEIRPVVADMMQKSRERNRLTAFSDCVAISSPADADGASAVLQQIKGITGNLLMLGVLVRGGIAVGNLFHESGIIVGPALIEAYKLEQQVAHYPRVLVSPAVLDVLRNDNVRDNSREFIRDVDGMVFVDVLGLNAASHTPRQLSLLGQIRKQLQPHADRASADRPGVASKYAWFLTYLDRVVDRARGALNEPEKM